MIFYLTYNDAPSGIYSGQVIDVVKFLNTELNARVKLVAIISLRNFLKNRKKIKNELSDALVLPMFPGIKRWKSNILLLYLISYVFKPKTVIGRSVLATQLALSLKKLNRTQKVIYDGRGAITAEWHEYQVINNQKLLNSIFELEKDTVLHADYRIAVSEQLILHWKNEFKYNSLNHVVIPCTLNRQFEEVKISADDISNKRRLMGLNSKDIVFVYSGSVAGWQSFDTLEKFIKPILDSNQFCKLVFFSELNSSISNLKNTYPQQVICKHLKSNEVSNLLVVGDYGILIREETITNKVASPVKFAEYLACGLKVIISDNLGDYSEFVVKNDCGYISTHFSINSDNNKGYIQKVAIGNFTKINHIDSYKRILINE